VTSTNLGGGERDMTIERLASYDRKSVLNQRRFKWTKGRR